MTDATSQLTDSDSKRVGDSSKVILFPGSVVPAALDSWRTALQATPSMTWAEYCAATGRDDGEPE